VGAAESLGLGVCREEEKTEHTKGQREKPETLCPGHAISNCVQIQKKTHAPPGVPEPTALKSTYLQKEGFFCEPSIKISFRRAEKAHTPKNLKL